jgi:hypothetical protein
MEQTTQLLENISGLKDDVALTTSAIWGLSQGNANIRLHVDFPQNIATRLAARAGSQQLSDDLSTSGEEADESMDEGPASRTPQPVMLTREAPRAAPSGSEEVPIYKVSNHISTVTDLWKEWKEGYGGKPPLELLETRFGAKWRNYDGAHDRFFRRRLVLLRAIPKLTALENKAADTETASWLEEKRILLGLGIDGLIKHLREHHAAAFA